MSTDNDGREWYAVYTQPNCEGHVQRRFTELKLDFFYPWYVERVRTAQRGRYRLRRQPYYPRYMFVREHTENLNNINDIVGVSYIVGIAGEPWPIPKIIMDPLLRTALPNGEILMGKDRKKRFSKGDILKITHENSPLVGMLLTFVAGSDIITAELVEKGLKVKMPVGHVTKLDEKRN